MLSDKQLTALNLLVYENKLKKDVAEAVGVIPETISNWFRSEEFVAEHKKMLSAIHQSMVKQATERLAQLINDEQSSTALGAVKLTLSIAGYDAVQKQEITQKTIVIGVEEENGNKDSTEEGDIQSEVSTISTIIHK
jgi:transcriptional regulator with XRE-family HTH domain